MKFTHSHLAHHLRILLMFMNMIRLVSNLQVFITFPIQTLTIPSGLVMDFGTTTLVEVTFMLKVVIVQVISATTIEIF